MYNCVSLKSNNDDDETAEQLLSKQPLKHTTAQYREHDICISKLAASHNEIFNYIDKS